MATETTNAGHLGWSLAFGLPSLLATAVDSGSGFFDLVKAILAALGLLASLSLSLPVAGRVALLVLHAATDFVRSIRGLAPLHPEESIADLAPAPPGSRPLIQPGPACVRPKPDGRAGCDPEPRSDDARRDPVPPTTGGASPDPASAIPLRKAP